MEDLKRFQGSIEDRDTILGLTAKIDAESVRSGLSHVPSQPAFFSHLFEILAEC